jgi:predicted ATP-dependent serine protease
LTEKRRKEGKCSKCGQTGHFWKACPSTTPVVYSLKPRNSQKRKRDENTTPVEDSQNTNKKVKQIEAPPVKRNVLAVGGPPPKILEVDTDMSD